MVGRVIAQAVVRVDQSFGAAIAAVVVDLAFIPDADFLVRQQAFTVAEAVAACNERSDSVYLSFFSFLAS